MSDTPRTDAIYPVELLDRGIEEHGRTWGWGIVSDFRDLARQLERELASVTKGSLDIEEERDELDRELQDADRRANSLMRELTEAKIGAARYEYVRSMNAHDVAEMFRYCAFTGMPLDTEVDRRRNKK